MTPAGHAYVPLMNYRKQGTNYQFNQIGFHMFLFEINTNKSFIEIISQLYMSLKRIKHISPKMS